MLGIEIIKRLGGGSVGGSSPGTVDLIAAGVTGQTYAQWIISFNGFTYKRTTSGAAYQSTAWINPQSGMDQYDVRATLASGDTPDGTLGTWLNLGSTRTWGWTNQAAPVTCNLTVEIRRVSDSVVVDTATVKITIGGTL